jgi:zinc protease
MTNDEIRMTKEAPNAKSQLAAVIGSSLWKFVIVFVISGWSFVIIPPLGGAELKLPPYSRITLSNGVVLLLMEQHEVPMVSFNVLVSAGSVKDPPEKEGLASLTADLLRRGTKTRSAEQMASEIDFLGGVIGFDAGLEFSTGRAQFLKKDVAAGLDLLADVLLNPSFPQEEVDKRVRQRIDELKQQKDEPQTVITNYFHSFLFSSHPYGRPVDGDEKSVANLKREEVLKFFNEQYVPGKIRIAAVGDFSIPEMQRLLSERFGGTTNASGPRAAPILYTDPGNSSTLAMVSTELKPATPVKGRKLLLIDKPDVTQSFYAIGNVGIARTNEDRVAIQLVNTIFGGRFTSMLNDELRVSSGLTYGARSQFGRYLHAGPFAISSFTQNSSTVKAIDLTLEILQRLHQKGLTAEQLKSGREYLKGQFPPQIETPDQLAPLLTQFDFYGLDEQEINDYFRRLDTVTLEESKRVIQKYFPLEDLVFVVVGKAAEVKQALTKYAPKIETREITQVGYK